MTHYRVKTYRTRGNKAKLSPVQMVDFMVVWFLFIFSALFFFSFPLESSFIIIPELLVGMFFVIIIYIPLRFKRRKEERENAKKILQSGIGEIDVMDGVEFEYYLEALFQAMGYNVQTTSASGDFGADLILTKDYRKIAVQVKRYNKTVGVRAVQEVYSSIPYYGATEAWIVTNNIFSKPAYELAEKNNIFLIDRGMLIEMIVNNKKASGS
ncbi:restriction endonuclease [Bacillus sp. ISL-45]|uniref:restriction endonuclease n=1 Tax=Bacillus sp. ISL-45 TaxID=2819128 RepID=UPI0020350EAF|nr:restriction endonuclease [Bacillus sp. ISL-45]